MRWKTGEALLCLDLVEWKFLPTNRIIWVHSPDFTFEYSKKTPENLSHLIEEN